MENFPLEEEPLDVIETRQVKRITMGQVFRSAIDAFNVDRGGVYTVKQLFVNPGAAIKDYLGANRFHYTPPFRILIITTALALLAVGWAAFAEEANIKFTTDLTDGFSAGVGGDRERVDATEAMLALLDKVKGYSNLILWTFIPIAAFFTWIMNLKRRFNYAEHLVFQTYLFCISNILALLFPLDHVLPGWAVLSLIYLGLGFYYTYGYKVFTEKRWLRSVLETIVVFLVGSTVWSVLLMITFGLILAMDMPS